MALTESYMLPLGTPAPDFTLLNVRDQQPTHLQENSGKKGTLIVFMCNHCPYVVHLIDAFVTLAKSLEEQGIQTIAISSNDIHSHPQDGPEAMTQFASARNFSFPYLYDATQAVAHAYQAACTPDFYLFDQDLRLFYRGRFDASRPGNELPLNGADLKHATTALLQGQKIPDPQYPSMGCNIKWKAGNEPK